MQKQYVQSEEAVVTRVATGQSISNAIANEEVEKKTQLYMWPEEALVTRVTIGQSIGKAIANEKVEEKNNTTCGLKRRW